MGKSKKDGWTQQAKQRICLLHHRDYDYATTIITTTTTNTIALLLPPHFLLLASASLLLAFCLSLSLSLSVPLPLPLTLPLLFCLCLCPLLPCLVWPGLAVRPRLLLGPLSLLARSLQRHKPRRLPLPPIGPHK